MNEVLRHGIILKIKGKLYISGNQYCSNTESLLNNVKFIVATEGFHSDSFVLFFEVYNSQVALCSRYLLNGLFISHFVKLGNCMQSDGVVPLNNKIFDPNMTNHTITYYHFPLSPPSRAALLLIRTLGIKHDVKIINIVEGEQNKPEFLKINPFHTVPAIDDNGFYVYDSSIIMKYLSKKYAKDDSLYPNDPVTSTLVEQRLYFSSSYLFQAFRDYIIPVMFENDQPSTEKAKAFDQQLQQLNNFLDNETWIAGKNITIADFSVITIISTAEAIMFDINKYPNLFSWYKRAKQAMASFGYEEVNQSGADQFGAAFKSKLKQFA